MSKTFKDFLKNKITKEQVDPSEARKLGHLVEYGTLNYKSLRSGTILKTFLTPKGKPSTEKSNQKSNKPPPSSRLSFINSALRRTLSFEDIQTTFDEFLQEENMSNFTVSDFSKMIPEFRGDSQSLLIFLKRCDTFHDSLKPECHKAFLDYLVFKLRDNAMTIYESKAYQPWAVLRKDLLDGIKVQKSSDALLTELMSMTQEENQSAKEFSDKIREKLKELNDLTKSQNAEPQVVTTLKSNFERTAIRTFREGLKPPLKYRIINFEATTLDAITKKAIEEKPFVRVTKSSTDTEKNLNRNSINNKENVNYFRRRQFSSNRPNNFRQPQQFFQRNWQNAPILEKNFASMNFSDNWRNRPQANHFNQNQPSTSTPNPFYRNNNYNNRNFQNTDISCLRCNRKGHTKDTCYVRMNEPQDKRETNGQQNTNHVSFLGTHEVDRYLRE